MTLLHRDPVAHSHVKGIGDNAVHNIEHYNQIKEQADKVTYTSLEYTADCMLRRNDHLVDGSSVCICYKTKNRGGTAYTVNYAHQQGLQVINLAE